MRTLDEVLKDLKEAEKEYADKCLQYGISEKKSRKKIEETANATVNVLKEPEEEKEANL